MSEQQNVPIIDTNDLKAVWKAVKANWYIVVMFSLIGAIGAYVFTYRQNDVYAYS